MVRDVFSVIYAKLFLEIIAYFAARDCISYAVVHDTRKGFI